MSIPALASPSLSSSQITVPTMVTPKASDMVEPANDDAGSAYSPLDPTSFPDPSPKGKVVKGTIENVEHLLRETGIIATFDEVKKEVSLRRNGKKVSMSAVFSEANRYGLSSSALHWFVGDIARENRVNPVRDWIRAKPWDGIDRLPAIKATLTCSPGYPQDFSGMLLERWFRSCVAAVTVPNFHTRGVLTLLGDQGLGKTTWFQSLVSNPELQAEYIKLDHFLDPHNKDSILGAIKHWIVELGELDGMMRKDVVRVKGVLTRDCDKIRPPYAREEEEFRRTTVFGASVNRTDFLNDPTGNSRFWVVEVDAVNYTHDIDMQQLFAQVDRDVQAGKTWWLNPEEEATLAAQNRKYRATTPIAERLAETFDLTNSNGENGKFFSASGALREAGIANPTTSQARDAGSLLRELCGPSRRRRGVDGWLLVAADAPTPGLPKLNPEDEY